MSEKSSKSQNGKKMVGYKAGSDEYEEIKSQADAQGLSLSAFLRQAVKHSLTNGAGQLEDSDNSLEKDSTGLEQQLERADSEIRHLREQLSRRDDQIDALTQSLDQDQRLLAAQTQISSALTKQLDRTELMIADMRKRPPAWRRVFRWT